MKLLLKSKFGSHLYGCSTDKSDTDYKGIFLPSEGDLILQKVSKSINNSTKKNCNQKNTSDDIDYELYSLHYFLELASQGETVALDMLHIPRGFEEITSPEWEFIRKNRNKFYTKNLKAYLGYCRTQASKYGIRSSRMHTVQEVITILKDNI